MGESIEERFPRVVVDPREWYGKARSLRCAAHDGGCGRVFTPAMGDSYGEGEMSIPPGKLAHAWKCGYCVWTAPSA